MYRKYIGYSFMNSLIFQTHVPENLGEWKLKTEEVVGCWRRAACWFLAARLA